MKKYPILDRIDSPAELKALDGSLMPRLASEIRHFLVDNVTRTGGHLASNLGVVEISLAIHRVFDTPKDHVIWDVGHQSYVHKLLTGRKKDFDKLRTPGGLSGFTKRSESEHDCFGAGHSSTSLSAGLGFAMSDARKGNDAYTVVVLGDGAFTGGMVHEALNNCTKDLRLIIIVNENEMSISRNKGGFARHMSRIRSTKGYFKVKDVTTEILEKIPYLGDKAVDFIRDTKQTLKNAIYQSNYFEQMGLYYMGPCDGNDYHSFAEVLEVAKSLGRSCVIHTVTKKGKGYKPAESFPQRYHMVPKGGVTEEKEDFSFKLGLALTEMAKKHKNVCGITAAMPHGTGLEVLKNTMPARFYDVGIAEEHAATFAAGLAANGMKPYFACYSSFLQRAYDSIVHDIALQNLPVTLCIDRTGLNEGDGATHHGIFDVSFLSAIPNIEIYTPATYDTLKQALEISFRSDKPSAIRYPKGQENEDIVKAFYPNSYRGELGVRFDYDADDALDAVIVTYGGIASEALRAEKLFAAKGIKVGTILLEKLKPHADAANRIFAVLPNDCKRIIFLEEGIRNGGAAQCLCDKLTEIFDVRDITFSIHAIDDAFITGEKGKALRQSAGITAESIVENYQ